MVLRCALPSACSVAYVKSTAVEAWNLTRLRLLKQNILQILEWLVKMYDVIVPKFCKITNRGLVGKRQNNRGPSLPRYKIYFPFHFLLFRRRNFARKAKNFPPSISYAFTYITLLYNATFGIPKIFPAVLQFVIMATARRLLIGTRLCCTNVWDRICNTMHLGAWSL